MFGRRSTPPGPGVDASGQSVRDPTGNVLDLVAAESKYQDAMRNAEALHVREVMKLRAESDEKARVSEAARLDALRQVDQTAIAADRAAAETRATTLAQTVADAAETVRTTLSTTVDPILKAISAIQAIQYAEAGQRAQLQESKGDTRADISVRGMIVGLGLAAAAILSTLLVGAVAITVTIILHG